jgi:hypothetical protein
MSWRDTRSRIAVVARLDPDADLTGLRQLLRAERLELHVRETVDSLTPEQCTRIATILLTSAGGG